MPNLMSCKLPMALEYSGFNFGKERRSLTRALGSVPVRLYEPQAHQCILPPSQRACVPPQANLSFLIKLL
jgi:hypothetical protein